MAELSKETCIPCKGGEPPLSDAQIASMRREVPEWEVQEHDGVKRLVRVFRFDDFKSALAFTNRVGAAAEEQGHHPALLTEWGRVTVSWWTHKITGLHRNDFIMAARSDALYQQKPSMRGA